MTTGDAPTTRIGRDLLFDYAKSFGVSQGKRVESAANLDSLVGDLREAIAFVQERRMPYVLELLTERFPDPGRAKAYAGVKGARHRPSLAVF